MDDFSALDIPPRFWELVEQGQRNRGRMEALLRELSREDLIRFYMEFRRAEQAIDERLDEYDEQEPLPTYLDVDAVGWIVSQGRAFCEAIYRDSAEARAIKAEDIDFTCVFGGSAVGVYEERFGENIPPDIDERWETPGGRP